jgi:signal transduction histidine kinase
LVEVPPAIERVLPILMATASGMNQIVDQMLDTARLEDSRLQLQVGEADLAAIVRESASTVRTLHAGSHPVRVRGTDQPFMVRCDSGRISTVVGNLVSNALKYSSPGSEVTVELGHGDGFATVAVSDCGIGIADADLPRLFTRFGRIDRAATADVPGTGLGLYLSRELARLHGGDIGVESLLGEGSIFTLSLPMEETAAEQSPEGGRGPIRRPQAAG